MPEKTPVGIYDVVVLENDRVAKDIYRLRFEAAELASKLQAGQFLELAVPGDSRRLIRIPLSYSDADPKQDYVETIYAKVGEGTERLSRLKAGDSLNILGPCGCGWNIASGDMLLIAGGIGITPILGLARKLKEEGQSFSCIIGAREAERLWGGEELKAAGADEVIICTDDGSFGSKGFVSDFIAELADKHSFSKMYSCGPEVMMAAVAACAKSLNIPCEVSMESMMSCGFGACATCVVPKVGGGYLSTCMNGPVFDAEVIAWA